MGIEFKQENIVLAFGEDTGRQLLVTQGEDKYYANGWSITSDVKRFVQCCLSGGLKNVIRAQHPRPSNRQSGVQYIGFSFPEDSLWSICIDQYSPNSDKSLIISQFSVQRRWEDKLVLAKIPFRRQSGGGKGLFVGFERLNDVIKAIS